MEYFAKNQFRGNECTLDLILPDHELKVEKETSVKNLLQWSSKLRMTGISLKRLMLINKRETAQIDHQV